jgi:N-acetylmuramoyl-L-alanine amidase
MNQNPFVIKLVVTITILVIGSCAHNPYSKTNHQYKKQTKVLSKTIRKYPPGAVESDSVKQPPYFVGTTNFNLRKPNFVIIHHTAQNSCEEALHTFTTVKSQVSAHYVICKDGTIHHMLNDYLRAWQAGISKWGSLTDVNSSSIGIELDNNGFEPFTEPQINSLLVLLDRLKKNYSIPTPNFIGHADIAPGRKVDPNVYFPWEQLAAKGFGFWYDTTNISLPVSFNHLEALRVIGYNVRDTIAAIQSYKLHFAKDTLSRVLSATDDKILYDLSKKYQ